MEAESSASLAQKSPIGLLHELCTKRHVIPMYELLASEGKTHEQTFVYRVLVEGISANGVGKSKKIAKQRAALRMLEKFVNLGLHADWGLPGDSPEQCLQILHTAVGGGGSAQECDGLQELTGGGGGTGDSFGGQKAAARLHDMCFRNKWHTPVYKDIGAEGPSHNIMFFVSVHIGSLEAKSAGRNKKTAKHNAAKAMLDIIEHMSYEERQETMGYCREDAVVTIQQPFPEMDEMLRIRQVDDAAFGTFYSQPVCSDLGEDGIEKFFESMDVNAEFCNGSYLDILNCVSREERWDFEFLHVGKNVDGLECFFLQLSTVPVIVVWGSGSDFEEAKNRAAWNALCHLKISRSHNKPVH